MTQEQKGKQAFFAQYWGQNLYTKECYNGEGGLKPVEYFSLTKSMIEEGVLELKPLSSISDEDAIEVAKIVTPVIFERSGKIFVTRDDGEVQVRNKNNIRFTVIEFNESAVYAYSEDEGYDHNPNTVHAVDFLRSRGYLLPFRNYSTDWLIDMGWAKIKKS